MDAQQSILVQQKNKIFITYHVMIYILDFIHPFLHFIICKPEISVLVPGKSQLGPLLPIELLISLNNISVLEEFKSVLLSYTFRNTLTSKISQFGNYSTMVWFQSNDVTINESILVTAAQRGDLELFSRIFNDMSCLRQGVANETLFIDACNRASQFGHLHILKFALSKFNRDPSDLLNKDSRSISRLSLLKIASMNGRLNVLQWYYSHSNNSCILLEMFDAATVGNQMDVILWIKAVFYGISSNEGYGWKTFKETIFFDSNSHPHHVAIAAAHGNLRLVIWLLKEGFLTNNTETYAAASGGYLDVMMYLRWENCSWSENVCIVAAEKGYLALLQWVKSNGCPWPEQKMFPAAAKSNNLHLYKWLLEQGCPFDEDESFINACEHGNFEFIKFALSNGSTFWDDIVSFYVQEHAAYKGDLETVLWSRAQTNRANKFWDASIIEKAAGEGHLHILDWFRTNWLRDDEQLPIIYSALVAAAGKGHVRIIEWAFSNELMIDRKTNEDCFLTAIKSSKLNILVLLSHCTCLLTSIQQMSPFPLVLAAEVGNVEVFKWLRKVLRLQWDISVYEACIDSGNLEIADWALRNGCPHSEFVEKMKSPTAEGGTRLFLSTYRST